MKKADSLVGKSLSDFQESKKFNRMVISCLAGTTLCLAFLLVSKDTEIVVMPPNYTEAVVVEGRKANQHFMEMHAMSIAGLIGNINERNSSFVVKTLLNLMSPRLKDEMGAGLENEAQILKIRKAKQTFVIEDMMYEPKNNLIWVWGTKTLSVKSGGKKEDRWTYEFRIEPQQGSPRITHYDSYPGTPKQRTNDEYVVDNSPYLSEALEKVANDPNAQSSTRTIDSGQQNTNKPSSED